jgi:RimJ/RimL family protein N-acetyltransferase
LSLSFVYGDKNRPEVNRALCSFAGKFFTEAIDFGPCMTLGVMRKGQLVGVVVFHDFLPDRGTIEFTIAANTARWLTRNVVNECARLAFQVNNCQMAFARCDAENKSTDRMMTALGFQKITIPNMRGKGRDESLFCMTQDAWNLSRFKNENTKTC